MIVHHCILNDVPETDLCSMAHVSVFMAAQCANRTEDIHIVICNLKVTQL